MPHKPFSYSDTGEQATLAVISQFSVDHGSWEEVEFEALMFAKRFLKAKGLFIDAGCGQGRLLPLFAPDFTKVLAIEPDNARLTTAQASSSSSNITFLNSPVEALTLKNVADTILSSHIIQHVSNQTMLAMLAAIHTALKPSGIFILTASLSQDDTDNFREGKIIRGKLVPTVLTQSQFEQRVQHPNGSLPNRKFSLTSLTLLLENQGFKLKALYPFHMTKNHPNGMDILVVAEK